MEVFSFKQTIPEWAIETELVADLDIGSASTTALPKAKKSDKVAVPSNLLPQMTKNFAVKEKAKREEGVEEGPVDKDLDIGKNKTKDTDKDSPQVDEEKQAATRLRKSEAIKRLAIERLRQQQKEKSREYKAPEANDMPKLKSELNKDVGVGSTLGAGLMEGAEAQRYAGYISKAIRRNWSLPKTYELSQAGATTILHMVLNARGAIVSVDVSKSSGDEVFDQYCVDATQKSAPFKAPPKKLAGQVFKLNCKPYEVLR